MVTKRHSTGTIPATATIAALRAHEREQIEAIRAETARRTTEVVMSELPAKGTPITMNAARKKYGVGIATINRWKDAGKISVVQNPGGRTNAVYVDERDVAMNVFVPSNKRGPSAGSRVLPKAS